MLTGLISDSLTSRFGEQALRYALTVIPFFTLWSALHLVLASRTLGAEMDRAQRE